MNLSKMTKDLTISKTVSALHTEDRQGADTSSISFLHTIVQNVLHRVQVLIFIVSERIQRFVSTLTFTLCQSMRFFSGGGDLETNRF